MLYSIGPNMQDEVGLKDREADDIGAEMATSSALIACAVLSFGWRAASSHFRHSNGSSLPTTMNPKLSSSYPTIATLTMFAAVLFTSGQAIAQSPPSKTATTWRDLGFNQLPDGFSIDEIPLFEGLNESRGTWSFEGQSTDGEATTPLEGNLQIVGNPQAGMLPSWKMALRWPADDSGQMIIFNIMASPRKTRFDLMLVRIGPVKNSEAGKTKPKVKPTMFQGRWNLENRTFLPANTASKPWRK